jgi:predicted molibdopterin-dependent oxidoreductase YjgC
MAHDDLRMTGAVHRGPLVTIRVDGREVAAYEGETVAAALVAARHRAFRTTERAGRPRGYFCGMGVCHDCLITIEGQPNVRACMTPVRQGLEVETQQGFGEWGNGR